MFARSQPPTSDPSTIFKVACDRLRTFNDARGGQTRFLASRIRAKPARGGKRGEWEEHGGNCNSFQNSRFVFLAFSFSTRIYIYTFSLFLFMGREGGGGGSRTGIPPPIRSRDRPSCGLQLCLGRCTAALQDIYYKLSISWLFRSALVFRYLR